MQDLSLRDSNVVITGGKGFLGTAVTKLFKKEKPRSLRSLSSKDFDLRSSKAAAKAVAGADIVIHLAANVGGIGYNQQFPAVLFYDNLLMGTNILHESWKANVKKFVGIGTICAYPKFTPVPFKEEDLWMGYPEETNAPYGLAKKMQLVQSQAYRQQYGFNSIYILPTNLYGPGDNFDPKSSHVIPALIQKFVDAQNAKSPQVTVWGTGAPTREFLYVEDAARGILLATKHYNKPDPVNLGSQFEVSIKDLAHLIAEVVGYTGKIIFDATKPDGQPRRKIDASRAKKEFNFESQINFKDGLKKTIEYYKKSAKNA